jgi:hypothetical protein
MGVVRRSGIWGSAGLVVVAAGVTAGVLLWPRAAPVPRARQYLDLSACLLTDPGGVVPGTAAAPVWSAMESASLATHVMVSYLPDTGPGDAGPMLNTLIERKCGVIVTTGAPPGTVVAVAKANPHQRFLLVLPAGASAVQAPPNASAVSSAVAASSVSRAVRALASQA